MSRFATTNTQSANQNSSSTGNNSEFGQGPAVISGNEKTLLKQKLIRKRSSRPQSLAHYKHIWLPPLLTEACYLLTAYSLGQLFLGAMDNTMAAKPLLTGLIASAAIGLAVYTRLNELFMPRAIIVRGVGLLFFGAIALILTQLFMSGFGDKRTLVTLIPMGLFLIRCLMVLRTARFAPSTREMANCNAPSKSFLATMLKRKKYWTN